MKLRRFNSYGIVRFDDFRDSPTKSIRDLQEVFENPDWSKQVEPEVEVAARGFQSRFEVGAFLQFLFEDVDIPNLDNDVGIWAWLSAYYFEQLCSAWYRSR